MGEENYLESKFLNFIPCVFNFYKNGVHFSVRNKEMKLQTESTYEQKKNLITLLIVDKIMIVTNVCDVIFKQIHFSKS